MRDWLALLVLPPVVALLPWSVALVRRRYRAAAALFTLWMAAWGGLIGWSFGPGLVALLALGIGVVATTTLERKGRERSRAPGPSPNAPSFRDAAAPAPDRS